MAGFYRNHGRLVSTARAVQEEITEQIPTVLNRFRTATEREPWSRVPADSRAIFLGELIAAAAKLALGDPGDDDLCRRMLRTAARHGESRLRQRCPDSLIYREYQILRDVVRQSFDDPDGLDDGQSSEAISRVDAALSLSAKASLWGYHHGLLKERGQWTGAIDRLVAEWHVRRLEAVSERIS